MSIAIKLPAKYCKLSLIKNLSVTPYISNSKEECVEFISEEMETTNMLTLQWLELSLRSKSIIINSYDEVELYLKGMTNLRFINGKDNEVLCLFSDILLKVLTER